jgi:hypothetical protein
LLDTTVFLGAVSVVERVSRQERKGADYPDVNGILSRLVLQPLRLGPQRMRNADSRGFHFLTFHMEHFPGGKVISEEDGGRHRVKNSSIRTLKELS